MKNFWLAVMICWSILSVSCDFDNMPTIDRRKKVPPVVRDGEVFELDLDVVSATHPELLFAQFYKALQKDWPWLGGEQRCVIGRHKFKLVSVGNQKTLADVQRELKKQGTIPCAQWLEVFKNQFPLSDYGNIGVADQSKIIEKTGPYSACNFPALDGDWNKYWYPFFTLCDMEKSAEWRWLVQVD